MSGREQWATRPDAHLVQSVAGGVSLAEQQDAFTVIYDRHASAVLAFCGGKLQDPDSAMDAASETFALAWRDLTTGRPPREPHKLRAWLYGIALNQCRDQWRRRGRVGQMPGDDIEDDSYERASRARRAQVDRILDIVAASFTEREQQIFQLSTRQGLVGQQLATALAKTRAYADNATLDNLKLAWEGFGAYVLATDGRRYCSGLARILEEYAWDGQTLTRVLRLRVLRHLDTCPTCDNCATCNTQKSRLIAPYAPIAIPVLVLARLRQRVDDTIRNVSASADSGPPSKGPRLSGPHKQRIRSRAAIATLLVIVAAAVVVFLGRHSSDHPPSRLTLVSAVSSCPNNAGALPYTSFPIPGTVRVPNPVTVPAGAAVYGTDLPDSTGDHAYYVIGPAAKSCSAYTGSSLGAGIDIGPPGSGSGVHEIWRAGGQGNVVSFVCPYIPQVIPAGGITACQSTAAVGQVASHVSTTTPAVYVTVVRVPAGVQKQGVVYTSTPEAERSASAFPTLALFAAHITIDQGQRIVSAPEISCTLPPAQRSTCSAALNYFLVQFAAREGMPPADLSRTIHTVHQLVG